MTGAHSQRKGANGEREVVAIYKTVGFDARRNFGSGSQGGGDITGSVPDVPEVKRVKALPAKLRDWIGQAREGAVGSGKPWCVWHRQDGDTWCVTIDAGYYVELLEDRVTLQESQLAEGVR